MNNQLKKYLLPAGFALAGLLGGYLYWRFVGCSSGSCPIWSNWHSSTLVGGIMGYLLGDTINDYRKKRLREGNVE